MYRKIEYIFYTMIVVCIASFLYGYWNRFDEKYILYKLPYTLVIEKGSKEYYINKEIIKQYPEFKNILFEEKILMDNKYINANNINKAINTSTEIGINSSDNLVIIAKTNNFIKIVMIFIAIIGIFLIIRLFIEIEVY